MKLYNTLTRSKEEFKPLVPGEVKMYSCGPTVYNYFHLGNARPFIVFDCLRQFLEYRGYDVKFVQNFTDVDDKLINKAREEGSTVPEIAEKYIKEYFVDAKALGIKEASVHPRATENIDAIIETVQTLIEKGHAYEVDGDVYFSVESYKDYGKLSHQPLEDLESGVRKDLDDKKHHPMDFALWKKRKTDDEIGWESPWGIGRPGWHIECTAMVNRYLGHTIDIHSGGFDLIFPHHENEIAQSVCANGTPFANYWLHNGFINVNNEKMSKSLGNFFTVRDIAEKYDYEVIRFFMLSAHYRSPINFCDELMDAAKNGLERIYNCIDNIDFLLGNAPDGDADVEVKEAMEGFKNKFIAAMEDDLNTADAISAIFEAVRFANSMTSPNKAELLLAKETILELGNVLGLLKNTEKASLDDEIEALIAERTQARKDKNWALADKIRDDLKTRGIVLEDTPDGVKWKFEK
ncbi:MAG: cysteine--tRNA ligase [Ruminococcaceae bacterium]|nr:cysteine--tRNA ligase [Oscillospiraceae bacterium]